MPDPIPNPEAPVLDPLNFARLDDEWLLHTARTQQLQQQVQAGRAVPAPPVEQATRPTPPRRRERRQEQLPQLTPDQIQLTQAYSESTAVRISYIAPGIEERNCVLYIEGGFGEARNMMAMADVLARHLRDRLNLPTPPPPPAPEIPLTLHERMFNLMGLMAERAEFSASVEDEWHALQNEYERYTGGRGL